MCVQTILLWTPKHTPQSPNCIFALHFLKLVLQQSVKPLTAKLQSKFLQHTVTLRLFYKLYLACETVKRHKVLVMWTDGCVWSWVSPHEFLVFIKYLKMPNDWGVDSHLAGRSWGWLWPDGAGLLRRAACCLVRRRSPAGATELCSEPSTCSPHPG